MCVCTSVCVHACQVCACVSAYMHVFACLYMTVCGCPQMPEEGTWPPGSGVTGDGKPPDMDAGNHGN